MSTEFWIVAAAVAGVGWLWLWFEWGTRRIRGEWMRDAAEWRALAERPLPIRRGPDGDLPRDDTYAMGMVNLALARRVMADDSALFLDAEELAAVGSRVLMVSGTPESGIRIELADYFDPRFGRES